MAFTKQLNITWTRFTDVDDLWSAHSQQVKNLIIDKFNEMTAAGKTDGVSTLLPTDTPGQVRSIKFIDDAACMEWLNFNRSLGYNNFTYQIFEI